MVALQPDNDDPEGHQVQDSPADQPPPSSAASTPQPQPQHVDPEDNHEQDAEANQAPPVGQDAPSATKKKKEENRRIIHPCPKAICIALAQIDNEGQWYTPMKEIARVSLGWCRERRKVPVARVRVDSSTPLELLVDSISIKKYRREPSTSWVPSISYAALREVIWELEVGNLSATVEVFARVECLTVIDMYNAPVAKMKFPPHVKVLRLRGHFNRTIWDVSLPAGLQELDFSMSKFNHFLDKVQWPRSLTRLHLGDRFNRVMTGSVLPPSLQHLSFGFRFGKDITKVSWPQTLLEISFGVSFNQPITNVRWPRSLIKLKFGSRFNQPVDRVSWPDVVELTFGCMFNHPVENVSWPASLQKLTFGKEFTQTIVPSTSPLSLERLTLERPWSVLPVCPGVHVSRVPG